MPLGVASQGFGLEDYIIRKTPSGVVFQAWEDGRKLVQERTDALELFDWVKAKEPYLVGIKGGDYVLDDTLALDAYSTRSPVWKGAGIKATYLTAKNGLNKQLVTIDGDGAGVLRDLCLNGNKAGQSGGVETKADHLLGYGVLEQLTAEKWNIIDVWIRDGYNDNLRIIGDGVNQTYGINEYRGLYSTGAGRFGIYECYDIDNKFTGYTWIQGNGSDNIHVRRPADFGGILHSIEAGECGMTVEGGNVKVAVGYFDKAQKQGMYINAGFFSGGVIYVYECSRAGVGSYDGVFFDNGGDYGRLGLFEVNGGASSNHRDGIRINTATLGVQLGIGYIRQYQTLPINDISGVAKICADSIYP